MCLMTSGRNHSDSEGRSGEPGRNRTFNQQIKSLLLCQLSYGPTLSAKWEVLSAKWRAHRRRAAMPRRSEDSCPFASSFRDATCLRVQPGRPRAQRARWRARQDSNLRPTDSKSGALSN